MKIRIGAKILAAVALARSFEDTRYYLNGVYISEDKAVATDGHIMTIATTNEKMSDTSVIMPVSKKAITALKKPAAEYAIFENDLLTVFSAQNEALYIEPSKAIEGTFPDWEKVLPKETSDSCNGSFSSTLLALIAQTSKVLETNLPLTITGVDKGSPHEVNYNHGAFDIYSVVMPMRVK